MKRERVKSSTIRAVGYDQASQTLEVEFHQGGVYQYFEVPEFIFRALMLASSKGVFFNRNVEDRYAYRAV